MANPPRHPQKARAAFKPPAKPRSKSAKTKAATSKPLLGTLVGCGALGTIGTLITTALSAAGVVTMPVVIVLLAFAWAISVVAIVCADIIWSKPHWRWPIGVLSAIISGSLFICLGFWIHAQRDSDESPPYANDGFLQLEENQLIAGDTKLQAGRPFEENFHMFNRGGRPVYQAQAWGGFIIANPQFNSDEHILTVFKTGIFVGYKKFSSSTMLGVNQEMWNTAVSEPLTDVEIDGIKSGQLRMWYVVGAVWQTENGRQKSNFWCSWLTGLGPDNDVLGQPWKNCD